MMEMSSDKKENLKLISDMIKEIGIESKYLEKKIEKASNEKKDLDDDILKPVPKVEIKKEKESDSKSKKKEVTDPFMNEELEDSEDDESDDSDDEDYTFKGE